ncbi:hypothetical protein HDU76_005523 [Blyttiomyces sp. JEL0837]|nr:hypothetical protein HDU76_005523 [Blyttiomyces sp. JEL0837]
MFLERLSTLFMNYASSTALYFIGIATGLASLLLLTSHSWSTTTTTAKTAISSKKQKSASPPPPLHKQEQEQQQQTDTVDEATTSSINTTDSDSFTVKQKSAFAPPPPPPAPESFAPAAEPDIIAFEVSEQHQVEIVSPKVQKSPVKQQDDIIKPEEEEQQQQQQQQEEEPKQDSNHDQSEINDQEADTLIEDDEIPIDIRNNPSDDIDKPCLTQQPLEIDTNTDTSSTTNQSNQEMTPPLWTSNANGTNGRTHSTGTVSPPRSPTRVKSRSSSSGSSHNWSPIVMHTFRWTHPGRNVIVTGSFDNWSTNLTMNRVTVDADEFELTVPLDRSQEILFKFVVDDVWRCGNYPVKTDDKGNVNNFLEALPERTSNGMMTPP